MNISRLDLDGVGSPTALVARIFEMEPGLPIPVPIEELCTLLDIVSIQNLATQGFEAALVTDRTKSSGAILVAKDRPRQRRRPRQGRDEPNRGASWRVEQHRRLRPGARDTWRVSPSLSACFHCVRSRLRPETVYFWDS